MAAFIWARFTASVLLVAAATWVIRRSLPVLPTDIVLSALVKEPEPSATAFE